MHLPTILVPVLAAAGATARNVALGFGTSYGTEKYPICPESYDTYCCMTVVPFSHSCRGGKCSSGPGWSCVLGPGKVDSMKYCLKEVGGDKAAYCKRPGYENFGSIIRWTGGSFEPMLKPSDYRQYLRAGMKKPWVPPPKLIRWEVEDISSTTKVNAGELRKREADYSDSDLA